MVLVIVNTTCSRLISSSDAAPSILYSFIDGNCSRWNEMGVQLSFQPLHKVESLIKIAPVLVSPRRPNKAFLRLMLNPSESRDVCHET